jgi:hypothetical protein
VRLLQLHQTSSVNLVQPKYLQKTEVFSAFTFKKGKTQNLIKYKGNIKLLPSQDNPT